MAPGERPPAGRVRRLTRKTATVLQPRHNSPREDVHALGLRVAWTELKHKDGTIDAPVLVNNAKRAALDQVAKAKGKRQNPKGTRHKGKGKREKANRMAS